MKTKYLLLAIAVLLVGVGWWGGRAAWRAHRGLVTLDVREAPLTAVLRSIQRQTWIEIRAEKALSDVRITLYVSNLPLKNVLNRIAKQAGARWSTLYAVYDSSSALKALDAALQDTGEIETAGWTKLAPQPPDFDQPPPMNGAGPLLSAPFSTEAAAPGGPGPRPRPGGRILGGMMRGSNGGVSAFFRGPGDELEIWSPEELVMESSLRPRLGDNHGQAATAAEAADTARRVEGHWTTYLSFKKSNLNVGLAGEPPDPPQSGELPRPPDPERGYADLTPEQRVQRARERLGTEREIIH